MTDPYRDAAAYWDMQVAGLRGRSMDVGRYLKLVEMFIDTGEVPQLEAVTSADEVFAPMLDYLLRLMNNPLLQAQVLGSRLLGRVFYAMMGRFIVDCLHHAGFVTNCQLSERSMMKQVADWSPKRREDKAAWQKLISRISEKHEDDGFDGDFLMALFNNATPAGEMTLDDKYERLHYDWNRALEEQLKKEVKDFVDKKSRLSEAGLTRTLQAVERHGRGAGYSDSEALQAWERCNGFWSETEFDRQMNLVKIQERYPDIRRLVTMMGRKASPSGNQRLSLATGQDIKMEHSSGSDIEGITTGRTLSALLPLELAQYADDGMEDVFIRKYVTGELQSFRYRSQMRKPSRRLCFEPSQRQGPMIVCIDTSASMYGAPKRIAESVLSLIEFTAESLHRDCFLIDFSVSIRTIDLMQRRKQQRYKSIGLTNSDVCFDLGQIPFIGGGTDSRNMLEAMFGLLDSGKYVNADVLWISDFLFDLAPSERLSRMQAYARTGTRFYGLCITQDDNRSPWEGYMRRMFTIKYRPLRRF